jgi:Trypsin-co-occurring domain 2
MADGSIGLAKFLEELRGELKASMANAEKDPSLAFELTKLDVELQITTELATDGSGKVKFWVVELGAGAKGTDKSVHTIKLSLQPMVNGEKTNLRINTPETNRPGEQPKPRR